MALFSKFKNLSEFIEENLKVQNILIEDVPLAFPHRRPGLLRSFAVEHGPGPLNNSALPANRMEE